MGIVLLSGCILLGLVGCAHYHRNGSQQQPFHSIYVAPVANRSDQVQIQGILWKQLVVQLNLAPSVKVISAPKQADAILTVVVTQLDQDISSTSAQDSVRAEAYRLTLYGYCSLVDNSSGRDYFQGQPISATINTYTHHRFVDSKYQAMPELARDFAQSVCNEVINSW